jgi:hypothetical protein
MKTQSKTWFHKNVDLIQLAVTFAATIVTLLEVIENPGRLAILISFMVGSIGFGASLAIFIIGRYYKGHIK